jgi:hypothetical protein
MAEIEFMQIFASSKKVVTAHLQKAEKMGRATSLCVMWLDVMHMHDLNSNFPKKSERRRE